MSGFIDVAEKTAILTFLNIFDSGFFKSDAVKAVIHF